MIAIHAVAKIPRDHRRIVRSGAEEIFNDRSQSVIEIAMKVAHLKQSEPLEGGWKRWDFPLLPLHPNIEKTPAHGFAQPENSQQAVHHGIERNESLQTKNPLALVNELCAFAGLPFQTLLEKTAPHSITESGQLTVIGTRHQLR